MFGTRCTPTVGDELLGERGLLVRHDAGLDHRLCHVRSSDRVAACDLPNALEVDRVSRAPGALRSSARRAEAVSVRRRSSARSASSSDPSIREHVQAGPRTRRRTRSPHHLDPVPGDRGRLIESGHRVVIGDGDPGQPTLHGQVDELRRRERAVGAVRVGVESKPAMNTDGGRRTVGRHAERRAWT